MNIGAEYHAFGRGDFLNRISAEIQFACFGDTVFIGGDDGNHFTRNGADGAVQRDDIFFRRDFVNRARETFHFVYGLVGFFRLSDGREHFAGLGDRNDAFLGNIVLFDGDNSVGSVHLEFYRLAVEDITVGGLHFDQFVIPEFQGFGHHQSAGGIGAVHINIHRRGVIDMLFHKFSGFAVFDFEADTGSGNDVARLSVLLHNLNECLKFRVVDEIPVGLPVLADKHIKGGHEFASFPALCLVNSVNAIGKVLALRESVFIADQQVALGVAGVLITAGRFQIHFKFRTDFRCFDFCGTIVRMLDDGNFALCDGFENIHSGLVVLHRVFLRLCANGIGLTVESVAFARHNFPDRPVIAADIVFGGKLAVLVGDVFIDQLFPLVDAVFGTGK